MAGEGFGVTAAVAVRARGICNREIGGRAGGTPCGPGPGISGHFLSARGPEAPLRWAVPGERWAAANGDVAAACVDSSGPSPRVGRRLKAPA